MKAIRRSLKGDKDQKAPQHPINPKSAIAIVPPKKVIQALYDYEPEDKSAQELAFHKGDFFHVLSREDDAEWYEACNPLIPTARGLVPVAYFKVLGKTHRESGNSVQSAGKYDQHDSGFSEEGASGGYHARSESANTAKPPVQARQSTLAKGSGAMVYGIVQYDFNAERADELEAKAGEAIIVIAQSTPEWFVVKPIGRLGGPGLVPVSFIEIKDMATGQTVTDVQEAVRRAGVPRVEEWKKMAAEYKNSSITLGQISNPQQQMTDGMARMSVGKSGSQQSLPSSNGHSNNQQIAPNRLRESQQQSVSLLAPMSASIPRYCFDNDMYWYIIECQMEDGRHWELSRYYADFYDFQIALIENFPEEAGNKGKSRTLPFMPGPVAHVTDAISNGRRQNLDEYIKQILSMPPHISKCMLVRQLFAPRQGDYEIDANAVGEGFRLSSTSQPYDGSNQASQQPSNGHTVPGSAYARAAHSRGPPSMSAGAGIPGPNGPLLHSQPSTLTQASGSSSVKANPGAAMKVKIYFQDETIVIRVPQDIAFEALIDKIRDRLKLTEDIAVQYKDEQTNSYIDLLSDENLDVALQRNPKLTLNVTYAET